MNAASGSHPIASDHPLVQATAAIRARDEHQVIELGRPTSPGWLSLRDLYAEGAIEQELSWVAKENADRPRPRDVAASYLASWIDSCVVGPAATLLVLEGLLPEVTPDNLWVHRHPTESWFDLVAFENPEFWCTADHPAANHPDAHPVGTRQELIDRLADTAVEHLTPLYSAIRTEASYGLRGMWGTLADDLAGTLTWITRRADGDSTEQLHAWRASDEILDAIAKRAPLLRVRPTPVEVEWSQGSTIFCRRGTCCLYYKTPEASEQTEADKYCSSCPLRDAGEQAERWSDWLESTASSTD